MNDDNDWPPQPNLPLDELWGKVRARLSERKQVDFAELGLMADQRQAMERAAARLIRYHLRLKPTSSTSAEFAMKTISHPSPSWSKGQILNDAYEVTDRLGAGGMGEVYRVRRLRDNAVLAAKRVLRRHGSGVMDFSASAADGFARREQTDMLDEILRSMRVPFHPSILRCRFFDIVDAGLVLFADFIPGGSLHDAVIAKQLPVEGPVARAILASIMMQTAEAVAHLHRYRVVHQDLKPHNVLVDFQQRGDVRVWVSDLGIARAAKSAPRNSGAELCAPLGGFDRRYASPEQLLACTLPYPSVTDRTDVYSWALTVLFVASGGHDAVTSVRRVAASGGIGVVRPLLGVNKLTPRLADLGVGDLLVDCLEERHEFRPSAKELVELLRGQLSAGGLGDVVEASDELHSKNELIHVNAGNDELLQQCSTAIDELSDAPDLDMSPEAAAFLRAIADEGRVEQMHRLKARMLLERGQASQAFEILWQSVSRDHYDQFTKRQRFGLAVAQLGLVLHDSNRRVKRGELSADLEDAIRLLQSRGMLGYRESVQNLKDILRRNT